MNDLSASGPVVKWSEQWWANAKPEVQAHRCTAHRKNGDRCKRAAIQGGRVCTHHGGSAPAVKAKARQRLEDAADRMAKQLLSIATGAESEAVRLAAIRDALDRAGLVAPKTVDVAIAPKPWEQIFDDIVGGSRAESRRRRSVPDEHELNGIEPILDAEVIESEPEADRTGLARSSNAEQASRTGRRTYTLSDFER